MILGHLSHGRAGFRDLSRGIGGISDSVLSERLAGLAAGGLITREVRDGPPVTVAYQLTERGRALMPALDLIARWARDNLPPDGCLTGTALSATGPLARLAPLDGDEAHPSHGSGVS